jgi:hypoxanthine phosphoribosyltransferase
VKHGLRVVYSPGRLAARVAQMGHAISRDYRGRRLDVIVMLENGFMFAADLIRRIDVPVVCHFVREEFRDVELAGFPRREVSFTARPRLKGRDVLLVDAILETGVPQEFLVRRLLDSELRSLKLAVLLDKPQDRKVSLHADYIGFVTASKKLVGYGLSASSGAQRNLRCVATETVSRASRRQGKRAPKVRTRRRKK